MLKVSRLFKKTFWLFVAGLVVTLPPLAWAEEFKKNETGLYRDIFDQNIYNEGTHYLHLERLAGALARKKPRAADINIYDEVPDSAFFTNRHGRSRLSSDELERGASETEGPDLKGNFTIVSGKFDGTHPGFFIEDQKGEGYLLKFDPVDFFELATSAEVIASRFYYAMGYNVPQYTIVTFEPSKLVPGEGAKIVDDTGFTKSFTHDKLEEYLLFLPQDPNGRYRASASKVLAGENKGFFSLLGRRRNDPEDKFDHKDRRELRALQVFSAWLNNYDIRESNTLDMLVTENGRKKLKHYLIDFNAALGSGTEDSKPPMVTHEHLIDYGETAKSLFTLGFLEKTWQKRWREAGEKINQSHAVGYFDNRYFDPAKFKNQLPHYLMKDLTRADGFWAAKIIMSFSDEDIVAMVKAGQLTNPADADSIAKILIERRDILGRYWFLKSNALDDFELSGNVLTFKDLAVDRGFAPKDGTVYFVDVFRKNGSRAKKIAAKKTSEPSIDLAEFGGMKDLRMDIRPARGPAAKACPFARVDLNAGGIAGISRED